LIPRLGIGRRQLELAGRHMAVAARASVAAQSVRLAIQEYAEAARGGSAVLAAAIDSVRRFLPVAGGVREHGDLDG
jgi:hypothetical protein